MKYLKLFEEYETKYKLYHETNQENYNSIIKNGFKIVNGERAKADELVPYGIFLKDNDKNIGLFDNPIQIKVEAKFNNTIVFNDRDEIKKHFREKDSCFRENIDLHDDIDFKYKTMLDDLSDNFIKNHTPRPLKVKEYKTESNKILKQWRIEIDEVSDKCRKCITEYMLNNGYDSMIIINDKGSWGRRVKTYISLKEDNIKIIE